MGKVNGIVALALLPVGFTAQAAQAEPAGVRLDPQANLPSPIAPDFSELGNTQVLVETPLGEPSRFTITGGTQVEQNLFHRFDRFNLNAGQVATFLTHPHTRAIFSQVSGGQASYIDGLLQVSGSSADLFVINPSGILFGPNARLDLGGSFTATTADWIGFGPEGEQWLNTLTGQSEAGNGAGKNTGFSGTANAFGFSASAPGSVVNQGTLAVPAGQTLRLLGGNVVNTGRLSAPGGEVSAIAVPGQSVVRLRDASGLLSVTIAPRDFSAIASPPIPNPSTVQDLLQGLSGPTQAEASHLRINADGSVSLVGGKSLQPIQSIQSVQPTHTSSISGQVDVAQAAGRGGQVNVIGERVQVSNAVVDASGLQGGTIRVGGAYQGAADLPGSALTQVDAASVLRADAIAPVPGLMGRTTPEMAPGAMPGAMSGAMSGAMAVIAPEGGQIVVWSDGTTQFAGEATARGLSAGGRVETSGKRTLDVQGARVDASSVAGKAGEWLLDPSDIAIATNGPGVIDGTGRFDPPTTGFPTSIIDPSTIENALDNGTSVTITTAGGSGGSGDIRLANSINQTGGGVAELTLTGRRFNRTGGARINLSSTGAVTFNLNQVNPESTPPTTSIQQAIDAIGTGSGVRQINLGTGRYEGAPGGSLITVNEDVAIAGVQPNAVIDGGGNARGFFVTAGTTATFQNIQIQNGFTSSTESGAGILNEGNLTLDNVVFSNNTAGLDGGGIDSSEATSSLVVTNGTFLNNRAGVDGGALFLGENSQLADVAFLNNRAGNRGGAIYNSGDLTVNAFLLRGSTAAEGGGIANIGASSVLKINNFLIEQNIATVGLGGGIFNQGSLTALDGTFDQNQAATSGGGIWSDGSIAMQRGLFSNNQAGQSGGGILNSAGTLNTNSVDFSSNRANNSGGAISGVNGDVQISQATIFDNQALNGGGIEYVGGRLRLLDNTRIEGNRVTGSGGGIELTSSLGTTIQDSFILNNRATGNGGGLGSYQSLVTVERSEISGNIAGLLGGGIEGVESNLRLDNVTIANNQAQSGGGISNRAISSIPLGETAIANSQLINNQAQQHGGGLNLLGINGSVRNSIIQGNLASQSGGGINVGGNAQFSLDQVTLSQNQAGISGGGLKGSFGEGFTGVIEITDSAILENRAGANGGGIDINPIAAGGTLNLTRSTVSQNSAGSDGGGVALGGNSTGNITNSTIAQNRADRHGGGLVFFGSANLMNTTVANNQADANGDGNGNGGGLYKFLNPRSVRLSNSIVANNQANAVPDIDGTFVDQGNNLIGIVNGASGFVVSTLVGTSTTPIDAQLAPLGNYGGLTQTMALLPGSDAIDAGNSVVLSDQRGIARVNAPDIGAFESRGFILTALGGDGQTAEVNTAFGSPLAVAIASPFGEPVDGGKITFIAPTTGASAIFGADPSLIPVSGGIAQIPLGANSIVGNYGVLATSKGIAPITLALSNTPVPIPLEPIPPPPIPPNPIPPTPIPPTPIPPDPIPPTPIPPTPITPEATPSLDNASLFNPPLNISEQRLEQTELSSNSNAPLSLVDGSSIQMIDQQFSAESTRYWGSKSSEGSSLAETRQLLRQAEVSHQAKSAVIYAIFVPQGQTDQTEFGSVESARLALSRRVQNTVARDDDQLLIVLIPSEGQPVQKLLDVTRQEVLQQAKLFRMAVSDPEDDVSYQPLARQLYQWLFAPVESDVQQLQLNNLMYVLDAGLRTVPLAAMMDGDTFIVERYGLSIIPSVDLVQTSFGDPPPPPQTVAAGADQFMQQADLPAVSLELAAIANNQASTRVLLNEAFTQSNLMSVRAQTQAKMLHLATHAEFNAGDLPSSYLQFWDSQLTFDQIRGLGWEDLELLILSACATAISSPEAELGFAGLAAATGVESSIGSLWNVSDVGTLALMAEFYGGLSQTPLRFEALRRSQLALLQGKTQIAGKTLSSTNGKIDLPVEWDLPESADFRHPFYWSGFTLVGNPWW